MLLATLPVSERALGAAEAYTWASPLTGKDVCRKGCNFGRLFVAETCDDIDCRFLGFGKLAGNGAGGEEAILVEASIRAVTVEKC